MNRVTALTAFAFAAACGSAFGCMPPPVEKAPATYTIGVTDHTDVMPGKLDARWFARNVYNEKGELVAIEAFYCPIVPNDPAVCRTGIVWERGKSALLR